jgi:hypothetical protein
MIDLKTVAEMARKDTEIKELCLRTYKDGPGEYEGFVRSSLELMEKMTADLAESAAANSAESVQ